MARSAPLIAAALLVLVGSAAAQDDDIDDYDEFVPHDGESFDDFDWLLCKTISDMVPGNMAVSPVGVKVVLAMLYEGAVNQTAAELRDTLHLPARRSDSRARFGKVLRSLQAVRREYVLDIGSKLYVRKKLWPKSAFRMILKVFYNTEIQKTDFDEPEQAVSIINSWVRDMTHGNINELISTDEVTPDSMLLLLNAIFFKGLWRKPFPPNETRPGPFHLDPVRTMTTDYMTLDGNFYYSESIEMHSKILRLPYMGKKYSMFLVLPEDKDGLEKVLAKVTPALIRQHMKTMTSEQVEVKLPKFKFEYTAHLKDILRKMGIKRLFEDNAELNEMIWGADKLSVSTIMQKAGLEVNEQGTVAYGATVVNIPNKFGGTSEFHATHPFMFFIEDETTGTVVFVGKVMAPLESALEAVAARTRAGEDNGISAMAELPAEVQRSSVRASILPDSWVRNRMAESSGARTRTAGDSVRFPASSRVHA
ncbi:serine protease inhibitor 27A-like [Bacillus rossius redtenbacheri]|uniref:serine protease inhibitor 27A-like n=1 Tax=Bacillus rossius redtenbacheri TaxID=93214 RepID=UPI002FDEFDBE